MKPKKTRDLLLKTAISLFAKKGYANTSIREIGSKAGVSTSVLYHYFKSKEEMLFEVIMSSSSELIQELIEIQEQSSDPVECLKQMLLAHMVHFSLKRKEETQILAADNHLLRGQRRLTCRKIQRKIYDLYSAQLKVIAEHGLINDVDRTVLAFSVFGMINSFYSWYREDGRLSKEEVAQNILDFIFYGILKR